ncbi:hypothetical protein [Anaerotignum faecicola]|nr:hypothetical protein [Anaerotignum faecicola]DAP90775.1 MAG TPA: hypothetical protein [Caudoviricetes sp.]
MSKQKKSGKVTKQSESKINLTAAILNLITAILILIDKLTG